MILKFPLVPAPFDSGIISPDLRRGRQKVSLVLIKMLYLGVLMHKDNFISTTSIYGMGIWRLLCASFFLSEALLTVYLHTNSELPN